MCSYQYHPSLLVILASFAILCSTSNADDVVVKPGHPSLSDWLLPARPDEPEDNQANAYRVDLGKKLFFDPRISGDRNMSCATCHNPSLGWSDGLPTAIGFRGKVLDRASPTIINSGFNYLQMWDGREPSLETQALGPLKSSDEMHMDLDKLVIWLNRVPGYQKAFKQAYPSEGISKDTFAKAIASYERTIVSNNSPFDQWVKGDKKAMTKSQVKGFKIFLDPDKGNCAVCHQAPNFTDNGFHNIGTSKSDLGRYNEKPISINKYAFKTPTLRDISYTAPYFHNGQATTLEQVVEHYNSGAKGPGLSPDMKTDLKLSNKDKENLVEFLKALSSKQIEVNLPILPTEDKL